MKIDEWDDAIKAAAPLLGANTKGMAAALVDAHAEGLLQAISLLQQGDEDAITTLRQRLEFILAEKPSPEVQGN